MKFKYSDPRIPKYVYRDMNDFWGDPKIREDAPKEVKEAFEKDLKEMKKIGYL